MIALATKKEKRAPARNGQAPESSPQNGAEINGHGDELQAFVGRGMAAQKAVDEITHGIGAEFQMLAVKNIARSPLNRATFDDEKFRELVDSVREHGVLQPIMVRPLHRGAGLEALPAYEIVMGERRWRAAGDVGLEMIPALVRTLDERTAEVLRLTENLQREDLRPLDEARGFKRLLDMGHKVEDLVAKLNRGKSVIYARLKLLELPAAAQKAVESGKLPASHAELIARLKTPEMQAKLTDRILRPGSWDAEDGVLSFRIAQDEAEGLQKREKNLAEFDKDRTKFQAIPGAVILDEKKSEKARSSDDYVRLTDRAPEFCGSWKDNHTWQKLTKGQKLPPPTLAHDYDGGPEVLYPRAEMNALAKANGHKQHEEKRGRGTGNPAIAKTKREKCKVNREVWRRGIRQLVAAVERGGDTEILLRFIASRFLARLGTSGRRGQEVVDARGLAEQNKRHKPAQILQGHVDKGFNAKQLRGFIVEAFVMGECEPYDFAHDFRPEFKAVCATWKVDLKRLEEEVRASGKGAK